MAATQITTSVTIINSLKGFSAISLTNEDDESAPDIAAGSVIEIAGAFFTFDSALTPQATTWTAVGTGNTAFITLTPSGTSGSQILTAKYTDTAPVFVASKQGYYTSSGSNIRAVATVRKGVSTSYERKIVLDNSRPRSYQTGIYTGTSPSSLVGAQNIWVTDIFKIGDWDMSSDAYIKVWHGIDPNSIRSYKAFIRRDTNGWLYDLSVHDITSTWTVAGTIHPGNPESSTFTLYRLGGGVFDSASFSATSYNRGWIEVTHKIATGV